MDSLEKQSRAFQGTLRRRLVVWQSYSLHVDHFFQLFLSFAIFLLRLSSPGKLPEVCVSPRNPQHLLAAHVIFGFQNLLVDFTDRSCQLMGPFCSDTAFAMHLLAVDDFWDNKIFFLGQFLFVFRKVTLNIRCYLMVVFCLISGFRYMLSGIA